MNDTEKQLETIEEIELSRLTLTGEKSALSANQIKKLLAPTPKKHRYTRPAKGGGTWEYVTGTYVQKMLNYVFGWDWTFEVKEFKVLEKQVIVLGMLTVTTQHSVITKEQFGRKDIAYRKSSDEPLDLGNDLKAASTDALKKCASMFGLASDIYSKEEYKEINKNIIDALPTPEKT